MSSNNIPKVKLEKKSESSSYRAKSLMKTKSDSSLLEPMINESKPRLINTVDHFTGK